MTPCPQPSTDGAKLADFVRVFHDALPVGLCDALVSRFTEDGQHQPVTAADGSPIFVQAVLTGTPGWEHLHTAVVAHLAAAVATYRGTFVEDWLPAAADLGWEQLRLKRYRPGTGERFPMHVDVVDHATARRALAFFAYLNDVDEGGETVFPTLGLGIRPRRGTVLVFPPLWLFPHEARPPVSGPKHILHSYLHYR